MLSHNDELRMCDLTAKGKQPKNARSISPRTNATRALFLQVGSTPANGRVLLLSRSPLLSIAGEKVCLVQYGCDYTD